MKEFAYIHEEGPLPEMLSNIPFLESFQAGHLNDILYSSYFIECEPGEVIIEEGQEDTRIFILLTGELNVIKDDELIATVSTSGEVFGELAIISDETRSASVVAKTGVHCLCIDQKFLSEIRPEKDNPSYYAAFYGFLSKVLAKRLKDCSDHLAQVEKELEDLKASKK